MKSEKGVTLVALVGYMAVFTIIIGIIATISSHFYKNVNEIKDEPLYIAEFNNFSMFFISDVKKNNEIKSISSSSLEFGDGTKYLYTGNAIYRNDERIAKNIQQFSFTQSDYIVDNFTKKIINVKTQIGNKNNSITRNIDFVLKYW